MNRRNFIACSLAALAAPFLPKKKGAKVMVNDFKFPAPKWTYNRQCEHFLYDSKCGVSYEISNRVNPDKCLGELGAKHINYAEDDLDWEDLGLTVGHQRVNYDPYTQVYETIQSGKADEQIMRAINKARYGYARITGISYTSMVLE